MNDPLFDPIRDKLLIDSLTALRRAGRIARDEAVCTGTDIIVVRDGEIVRVTAEELRRSGFGLVCVRCSNSERGSSENDENERGQY